MESQRWEINLTHATVMDLLHSNPRIYLMTTPLCLVVVGVANGSFSVFVHAAWSAEEEKGVEKEKDL